MTTTPYTKTEIDKWVKENAHIPTPEVEHDISDTEAEITVLHREIDALRTIGDKMSMLRADGKFSGIIQRENFINKLKAILESRKNNAKS